MPWFQKCRGPKGVSISGFGISRLTPMPRARAARAARASHRAARRGRGRAVAVERRRRFEAAVGCGRSSPRAVVRAPPSVAVVPFVVFRRPVSLRRFPPLLPSQWPRHQIS